MSGLFKNVRMHTTIGREYVPMCCVHVCLRLCAEARVDLRFHVCISNSLFASRVCPRCFRAMSKENKRPRNGDEVQRANVVKLNVGGKDGSLNKRASEHALRRAEY